MKSNWNKKSIKLIGIFLLFLSIIIFLGGSLFFTNNNDLKTNSESSLNEKVRITLPQFLEGNYDDANGNLKNFTIPYLHTATSDGGTKTLLSVGGFAIGKVNDDDDMDWDFCTLEKDHQKPAVWLTLEVLKDGQWTPWKDSNDKEVTYKWHESSYCKDESSTRNWAYFEGKNLKNELTSEETKSLINMNTRLNFEVFVWLNDNSIGKMISYNLYEEKVLFPAPNHPPLNHNDTEVSNTSLVRAADGTYNITTKIDIDSYAYTPPYPFNYRLLEVAPKISLWENGKFQDPFVYSKYVDNENDMTLKPAQSQKNLFSGKLCKNVGKKEECVTQRAHLEGFRVYYNYFTSNSKLLNLPNQPYGDGYLDIALDPDKFVSERIEPTITRTHTNFTHDVSNRYLYGNVDYSNGSLISSYGMDALNEINTNITVTDKEGFIFDVLNLPKDSFLSEEFMRDEIGKKLKIIYISKSDEYEHQPPEDNDSAWNIHDFVGVKNHSFNNGVLEFDVVTSPKAFSKYSSYYEKGTVKPVEIPWGTGDYWIKLGLVDETTKEFRSFKEPNPQPKDLSQLPYGVPGPYEDSIYDSNIAYSYVGAASGEVEHKTPVWERYMPYLIEEPTYTKFNTYATNGKLQFEIFRGKKEGFSLMYSNLQETGNPPLLHETDNWSNVAATTKIRYREIGETLWENKYIDVPAPEPSIVNEHSTNKFYVEIDEEEYFDTNKKYEFQIGSSARANNRESVYHDPNWDTYDPADFDNIENRFVPLGIGALTDGNDTSEDNNTFNLVDAKKPTISNIEVVLDGSNRTFKFIGKLSDPKNVIDATGDDKLSRIYGRYKRTGSYYWLGNLYNPTGTLDKFTYDFDYSNLANDQDKNEYDFEIGYSSSEGPAPFYPLHSHTLNVFRPSYIYHSFDTDKVGHYTNLNVILSDSNKILGIDEPWKKAKIVFWEKGTDKEYSVMASSGTDTLSTVNFKIRKQFLDSAKEYEFKIGYVLSYEFHELPEIHKFNTANVDKVDLLKDPVFTYGKKSKIDVSITDPSNRFTSFDNALDLLAIRTRVLKERPLSPNNWKVTDLNINNTYTSSLDKIRIWIEDFFPETYEYQIGYVVPEMNNKFFVIGERSKYYTFDLPKAIPTLTAFPRITLDRNRDLATFDNFGINDPDYYLKGSISKRREKIFLEYRDQSQPDHYFYWKKVYLLSSNGTLLNLSGTFKFETGKNYQYRLGINNTPSNPEKLVILETGTFGITKRKSNLNLISYLSYSKLIIITNNND